MLLGLSAIAYSLFTDYELGAIRTIPMTTHLGLDVGCGVILTASPWIIGFAELVYLLHLILGLFETARRLPRARCQTSGDGLPIGPRTRRKTAGVTRTTSRW